MAFGKRPPPNVDYPPEIICKFCAAVLKRHCDRCTWYPCKVNKTITRISGFRREEDGGVTWLVTHRAIDPHFFYF